MNTSKIGSSAEDSVASYLHELGHKIVSQNWKTAWCEIDIVSTYKGIVFFTEVKYRSNDAWGDGFSYITKTKLKQMKFAAENWIHSNKWEGDAQLLAAAVDNNKHVTLIEI